jgi:hypothetical protein
LCGLTVAGYGTGPNVTREGEAPGGKPTPRLGLPYCAEHFAAAYKRSFANTLRIRPDYYNGAGALPHHKLAA